MIMIIIATPEEWMFATVFAIELLMKIFALGRNFFKDASGAAAC